MFFGLDENFTIVKLPPMIHLQPSLHLK